MNKITTFFKEAYEELTHKVTWPKISELQNSSMLVLVASLIFALMIGLFDLGFEKAMTWFYQDF